MSNYYQLRDSKVRMAQELTKLGWKLYGWKDDESDSMTDYYSPANWDGIATKNGFVLVVDNKGYNSGKEITKYNPAGNLSIDDREKISKLQEMTVARGCTEAEAETAQRLIQKLQGKTQDKSAYEVVDKYPIYMANPGKCKWHIEKDGKLYDKGTGIIKFSQMPETYEFDIVKMEYTETYKNVSEWTSEGWVSVPRKLTDEQRELINQFKQLILRFERVASGCNGMGDGTAETAAKAEEQQQKEGYEKVIEQVKKIVTEPVAVNRKMVQVGDLLKVKGYTCYWKVISINEERKTFTYEQLGKKYQELKNPKRYYTTFDKLEKGYYTICELQEVEQVTEVEKWVKIDKSKNTYNTKQATTQEKKEEQAPANKINYTVTADVDTRDNSPLWVVKLVDKLSREEYIKVAEDFKALKGYYSKFKHGFIFKYDPSEVLEGHTTQTESNTLQEVADNITDVSTSLIIDLGLNSKTYSNSEEYKNQLAEYIQKHNIIITSELLDLIAYDGLKTVLVTIKSNTEQAERQAENNKLIEKIDNNIESLQKKIDSLSGDYKTNTHKRMKEQANREGKIESYEIDIRLLEYVKDKILDSQPITELDKGLLVASFRQEMHNYYIRKYGKYPQEITFPQINYSYGLDNWYNKEVPTMQKRLQKYNITNTEQLNKAIDEYKAIYKSIDKVESPREKQIKQLEREYKLQQKGDFHITSNKSLLSQLMELADIQQGEKVLEPSAGIGSIADEVKKYTDSIEVCEYMYSYAELLRMKGYTVTANDFLTYEKINYYDKVVANVPFSDEQRHVKHIYNVLKDGGRAVIITSNSWTFTSDKASQEFRQWLNSLTHEVYDVPAKSFEFTNVGAKILVIDKDVNTMSKAI